MKIAFLVLMLAAVLYAANIESREVKRPHTKRPMVPWLEPDCREGKDCEVLCNWQCYNSVGELCIDGSCFCKMEGLDKKKM